MKGDAYDDYGRDRLHGFVMGMIAAVAVIFCLALWSADRQPRVGFAGCSTDLECYGHGGYEIPGKDGAR